MTTRPDLRLVEGPEGPVDCVMCGERATMRSAVDDAPLCLSCFTGTHWHPSWNREYDGG